MQPFARHLFVCSQAAPEGCSCRSNGSAQVLQALERELISQGLQNDVQLTACACLGLCEDGPIVIVYPEGVWYRKVKAEDVPEIVTSHLRSSNPVSRLTWNDAQAVKLKIKTYSDRWQAVGKARDESAALPDYLNQVIRGFMPSRTVLTALELDVFTAIGNSAPAESVAQKIHADARATEMLLNALVSLEMLEKKEQTFFNTPGTARFFCQGSRDNARDGLMHMANLWHRWSRLTECVRSGTSVETRRPGWTKDFIAAMDRGAKENVGAVIDATAGRVRRMLDLGGGSGAYSIAFAKSIPELRAEILDLSDVIPLTRENIEKAGLADRITTRTGDILHDPLGEDYDLVLVSQVSHVFSPEENRLLFTRAFHALAPGGQMILQDFILAPDKTAPRVAVLFALNMLAGSQAGCTYTESEYASWFRDAGFRNVRRIRPGSLMIGFRA